MIAGKAWLLAAGALSALAALLHLACIVGGPSWYRMLGAGERFARAAERGEWFPTIMTLGIAVMLSIWAAYAFSSAGFGPRLPLRRTALCLISLVLALRGLAIFAPDLWRPDLGYAFKFWSSLAVLILAALFAVGTKLAWTTLSLKEPLA